MIILTSIVSFLKDKSFDVYCLLLILLFGLIPFIFHRLFEPSLVMVVFLHKPIWEKFLTCYMLRSGLL